MLRPFPPQEILLNFVRARFSSLRNSTTIVRVRTYGSSSPFSCAFSAGLLRGRHRAGRFSPEIPSLLTGAGRRSLSVTATAVRWSEILGAEKMRKGVWVRSFCSYLNNFASAFSLRVHIDNNPSPSLARKQFLRKRRNLRKRRRGCNGLEFIGMQVVR